MTSIAKEKGEEKGSNVLDPEDSWNINKKQEPNGSSVF
jgi:hypothetical protein